MCGIIPSSFAPVIGLFFSAIVGVSMNLVEVASASDAKGTYSVRGIGTIACSEVVQMTKTNEPQLVAVVAWTDGVLTATNRLQTGIVDAVPYTEPPGLLTTLSVNLCVNNPQMTYDTAVLTVLGILAPVALKRGDPEVRVTVGDATVSTRAETLKLSQSRLIKLKLLSGTATGTFNKATSEALRKFQKQRNLTENGLPDAATVFALLLN